MITAAATTAAKIHPATSNPPNARLKSLVSASLSLTTSNADVIFEPVRNLKMEIKYTNDEKFVQDNFEKLVNKYGGQTIVIANSEIFTDRGAAQRARKKYPRTIPYLLTLPRPEFFANHFLL